MSEHPFDGFARGKQPTFAIYAAFISELLPQIDDLAELKVTLYFMWAIQQREGRFRYLRQRDFLRDTNFMAGIEGETGLAAALDKACVRGTLLCAEVTLAGEQEPFYFINTELGRQALEQVRRGDWLPSFTDEPLEIIPDRPNIYRLYEDNIGPLTPLIADTLKDAEKNYPQDWIVDALRIAARSNARKWSFVQAVLDRWQREGKKDASLERSAEQDGRRYISGKYADYIEH